MHFKAKGPKLKALKWFIMVKSIFIFAEVTTDKATRRSVTLKSGKMINFLQNHCQNHIFYHQCGMINILKLIHIQKTPEIHLLANI